MRSLRRNQQPVFYRQYEGETEYIDQNGNPTGSYIPIYGELQSAFLCVSPNKGSAEVEMFGSMLDYDRTMTTSDQDCDIDEDCVLWLDGADPEGPWNYQVIRRAPWKNSVTYAIRRVDVKLAQEQFRQFSEMRGEGNA